MCICPLILFVQFLFFAIGLDHTKIFYQFIPTPDGGIIRMSAVDDNDNKTTAQIKRHIWKIQKMPAECNYQNVPFI
jgi:hypothetical protein